MPCSRVGHIFRPLPYPFNADYDEEVIKLRNTMRVAEVYMDENIAYYRSVIPRKLHANWLRLLLLLNIIIIKKYFPPDK